LEPLAEAGVDAVVLGCTHYPLLRPVIETVGARMFPSGLTLADGAEATAAELATLLTERELRGAGPGGLEMLVTDLPDRFAEVASRFLGEDVEGLAVKQVDL
ncbi:MAG: glutamate racemase, partial [Myxococcales bacterium]|nr:glutamate racemase [Myxococcales bacterium]